MKRRRTPSWKPKRDMEDHWHAVPLLELRLVPGNQVGQGQTDMKTIRRIYFYLVTAISMELLAWGVVNLLHRFSAPAFRRTISITLHRPGSDPGQYSDLYRPLVGRPKGSDKSEEEQTSLIRAMYLYGILLGTLVPVVQNILAFVNRLLLDTTGVSRMTALVGRSQTLTDNLIAIGINLILAGYFYSSPYKGLAV